MQPVVSSMLCNSTQYSSTATSVRVHACVQSWQYINDYSFALYSFFLSKFLICDTVKSTWWQIDIPVLTINWDLYVNFFYQGTKNFVTNIRFWYIFSLNHFLSLVKLHACVMNRKHRNKSLIPERIIKTITIIKNIF